VKIRSWVNPKTEKITRKLNFLKNNLLGGKNPRFKQKTARSARRSPRSSFGRGKMIAFCNHLFIKIILNQNLKNNKNDRSMVRQVHSDFEIRFFFIFRMNSTDLARLLLS
jgi:hypothetical protein